MNTTEIPLYEDVKKWVLDPFSFLDGIGYNIEYDENFLEEDIKMFSIDVDGLTKSDAEKGKENILNSVSDIFNSDKSDFPLFPIVKTMVVEDGDLFVLHIVLMTKEIDKNSSFKEAFKVIDAICDL